MKFYKSTISFLLSSFKFILFFFKMAAMAIRQFLEDLEPSEQPKDNSPPPISPEEYDLKDKKEKMENALQILRKKRSVVTLSFLMEDGSPKDVMVNEDMTSAMVCHLLAMKNHADKSPHWEMIERIGDLGLERVLEDHENVVDIHTSWPRDNKNIFVLRKNEKKYDLLENPQVRK